MLDSNINAGLANIFKNDINTKQIFNSKLTLKDFQIICPLYYATKKY